MPASLTPATSSGVRFAIKNTFIDGIAEEEEERQQRLTLGRRRTEPCLYKTLGDLDADCKLGADDCSTDCHSDNEGGNSSLSSPAASAAPMLVPATPAQQCATPSPRARVEEERPRFRTAAPAPASAAALAAPMRAVASSAAAAPSCAPTASPATASTAAPAARMMAVASGALAAPTYAQVASAAAPAAPMRAVASGALGAPTVVASATASPEQLSVHSSDKHLTVARRGDAWRVEWMVDARKLRGSDKQVVSPALQVTTQRGRAPSTFKIMLYPKGGASFRRSEGEGSVQLKCCSDLPEGTRAATSVSISVGSGRLAQQPRGPFVHHFAFSSVFGLPKDNADWDFASSVDPSSITISVVMELKPLA